MEIDIRLLSVFRDLEPSAGTAWVRFHDGDAYIVRVISAMHAEAGDDIVVEVLSPDLCGGDLIPTGSFINFQLADIAEVRVGMVSVLARAPDAKSSDAPDTDHL